MRRCIVVVSAILWAGCSKSDSGKPQKRPDVAETIKALGAAAEPAVAGIEKIAKLPPNPNPSGSITLDGPALSPGKFPVSENWAIVYREDLADLTTPATHKYEIRPGSDVPLSNVAMACTFLLRKGAPSAGADPFGTKDRAEFLLKSCATLKYLAVVDTQVAVPPTVDEASKTFTPGAFKGLVTLYSIPGAKELGGFPVEVVQKDSEVTVYDGKAASSVRENFEFRLRQAIKEGMEKAK